MARPAVEDFKDLSVEVTVKQLGAHPDTGLAPDEVKKKLAEFGHNEVPEKKKSPLVSFLKRFWGLTAWMLELTIVISYVLGRFLDLAVIAALLIMNTALGFAQERQAERAVEALKRMLSVKARVLRNGD
jgi:H+-transporting ATPase